MDLQVYYKKHCAATLFLPKTEWMVVLDADTGTAGVGLIKILSKGMKRKIYV